jgi:hypothetical protein
MFCINVELKQMRQCFNPEKCTAYYFLERFHSHIVMSLVPLSLEIFQLDGRVES